MEEVLAAEKDTQMTKRKKNSRVSEWSTNTVFSQKLVGIFCSNLLATYKGAIVKKHKYIEQSRVDRRKEHWHDDVVDLVIDLFQCDPPSSFLIYEVELHSPCDLSYSK